MLIRRATTEDVRVLQALVQAALDETYGGLWAQSPLPLADEDWSLAWISVDGATITGLDLTHEEWLGVLWVLRQHQGHGTGSQLLARAEQEIQQRGFITAHLRVVSSNHRAVRFYQRHGWTAAREFPHETLPITMLELTKRLDPVAPPHPAAMTGDLP